MQTSDVALLLAEPLFLVLLPAPLLPLYLLLLLVLLLLVLAVALLSLLEPDMEVLEESSSRLFRPA